MREYFRTVLLILFLALPSYVLGQAPQPTSLSSSTSSVYQGQCYVLTAGNGANLTLDVQYTFNGGSVQTITGWPALDGNGQANICTDTLTALGSYAFVAIRNTANTAWVSVNAPITVNAPPPQPTSLSFGATQGYAGNDCYTMTVGAGANMTVDLQYAIDGIAQPVWSTALDANGQWAYCLNHYDGTGTRTFTGIKNSLHWQWVALSPAVNYTVLPPQPKSFAITPSAITAGTGNMTMTAANGANVTLDVQYTLSGGATQTYYNWPGLSAINSGPDGSAETFISTCTTPGNYLFTAVRNHLNSPWLSVNAPVSINPPPAPTVTTLSQASAARGSVVSMTLNGTSLCGVSLSTTWPGLTFSDISNDTSSNGGSITATFSISSAAAAGIAPITLTANGGSTTFNFTVTNSAAPSITGMTPPSALHGTSVSVTMSGSNLTGANLSTSWSGLSFSNATYDPQGLWLTATFNIASGAAAGAPDIQVTTSAGSTSTQLFSITQAPVLSKEYIYLGDRAIAIDQLP